MLLASKILTGLVLLLHVYIVLLETIFFRSRGVKVFRIPPEFADVLRPALSNQGCYNGFLVAALGCGLLHPEPAVAYAFTVFGLSCVGVAGIWGALTVMRSIFFIQTVPASLALIFQWIGSNVSP